MNTIQMFSEAMAVATKMYNLNPTVAKRMLEVCVSADSHLFYNVY